MPTILLIIPSFLPTILFLVLDPIQVITLHLVVLYPESFLGCDGFSHFSILMPSCFEEYGSGILCSALVLEFVCCGVLNFCLIKKFFYNNVDHGDRILGARPER